MCGGSVFYLASLLRQNGHEEVIKEALENDSIVYTGSSAGSAVLAHDLTAFSYDDHEAEHISKVPDMKGPDVVPFGILCHSNNAEFVEENKKIIESAPNNPTALFFIHDHQVLWMKEGRFELLEA